MTIKKILIEMVINKLTESTELPPYHAYLVDEKIMGVGNSKAQAREHAEGNIDLIYNNGRKSRSPTSAATWAKRDLDYNLKHHGHYHVSEKAYNHIVDNLLHGDETADSDEDAVYNKHLKYDHQNRTIHHIKE